MHSHAIKATFFDSELSDFLQVLIFEVQEYISFGPVGTNQFNLQNFHLSWLIFLQSFFFDIPKKVLFICFKWFIIFVLNKSGNTKQSISERLTLKFWGLTLVLAGSCVGRELPSLCRFSLSCNFAVLHEFQKASVYFPELSWAIPLAQALFLIQYRRSSIPWLFL